MALSLTIDVDDAGRVSVQGPLENQLVCYGLLEVARDAIQAHVAAQMSAKVKPASPSDIIAIGSRRPM